MPFSHLDAPGTYTRIVPAGVTRLDIYKCVAGGGSGNSQPSSSTSGLGGVGGSSNGKRVGAGAGIAVAAGQSAIFVVGAPGSPSIVTYNGINYIISGPAASPASYLGTSGGNVTLHGGAGTVIRGGRGGDGQKTGVPHQNNGGGGGGAASDTQEGQDGSAASSRGPGNGGLGGTSTIGFAGGYGGNGGSNNSSGDYGGAPGGGAGGSGTGGGASIGSAGQIVWEWIEGTAPTVVQRKSDSSLGARVGSRQHGRGQGGI